MVISVRCGIFKVRREEQSIDSRAIVQLLFREWERAKGLVMACIVPFHKGKRNRC